MDRRQFLLAAAGSALTPALASAAEAPQPSAAPKSAAAIPVIDNDPVIVYESPDPERLHAYSPGLAVAADGRLVATIDLGWDSARFAPGVRLTDRKEWPGRIFTSDDDGRTWQPRGEMPLCHARPFAAGKSLYVIGHLSDLGLMRSDDNGNTWSGPYWFTEGERWHQAPCNVHYTRGRVYLVMERDTDPPFPHWPVSVFAPVVMSADVNADLTRRESWVFSNELTFAQAVEQAGAPNLIGVPFYPTGALTPDNPVDERRMSPIGWLETNIVQFTDPDGVWYDPTGRTFHLWMRAHTGSTGYAAIAKAVEAEDGSITVSLEKAPSGETILFVPCPGGQMKFHILYDEPTKLFWLLSSQATDSMRRVDRLPPNRFSLPNNERHRLVLHFSRNCIDWCFAGRVADTGEFGQSRHYASMVIKGDDLFVLSRSGDARAKSAHDGNLITFHTVKGFRGLVY
jgi:hypothetical protein